MTWLKNIVLAHSLRTSLSRCTSTPLLPTAAQMTRMLGDHPSRFLRGKRTMTANMLAPPAPRQVSHEWEVQHCLPLMTLCKINTQLLEVCCFHASVENENGLPLLWWLWAYLIQNFVFKQLKIVFMSLSWNSLDSLIMSSMP